MHVFVDNADRTWTVNINVTAVKRCRAQLNVDLYALVGEGFGGLAKLLGDPVTLIDVLYVLCRDECDKLGVSDEDFGRAMGGDSIQHAADCFVEELTDFFPDPKVRATLKKVMAKGRTLSAMMIEDANEKIDALDPASLRLKSNGQSINSRESSQSTPDLSHSAS